jgi:DNA processing protein
VSGRDASQRDATRPGPAHLDSEQVAAATLASLPDMTHHRLRMLVARGGGPIGAVAALERGLASAMLCDGAPAEELEDRRRLALAWARAAVDTRVPALLAERRPHVLLAGRADYPIDTGLADRPEVLVAEGDRPEVLDAPCVAVVGTRAATPNGLDDAHELGATLARAGVTVVSGLAIGIDGAVHEGALAAGGGVVGVVATGLDVVYPRRHRTLDRRVREAGLVVSELGYGVQPRAYAFPVRNRIIAALAQVTVVVEATVKGGARITADHALTYGRTVMAYPGSRRNPAAAGTNQLLYEGATMVLEPSDVLLALGLSTTGPRPEQRTLPLDDAAAVLEACHGEPATLDQLASRARLAPSRVIAAVRALERNGWMERSAGLCWPR